MPTKEVAVEIAAKLMAAYPDADCELNFANTYQLITSVILSAQCTDQQVNRVTAKLFKQFPTAKDLAQADIDKIKEIIRPTGYFNAKAKNIQACARMYRGCPNVSALPKIVIRTKLKWICKSSFLKIHLTGQSCRLP